MPANSGGPGQGGYIPVHELPTGQERFAYASNPTNYAGPALTAVGSRQRVTALQTARVDVRSADGTVVKAAVIFDTGAERSYLSSKLRKRIRPTMVGREWVSYGAFGGEMASPASLSSVFQVEFRDLDGRPHMLELAEIPIICPPLERTPIPAHILEGFRGLVMADEYSQHDTYQVDVLIGQDYYWTIVDYVQGHRSGSLVALPTPFGYIVSGNWGSERVEGRTSVSLVSLGSASSKEITMFWDLERLGISGDEVSVDHLENHPVIAKFQEGLSYNPKLQRYQVSALYKNEADKRFMTNNVAMASKRAESLRRKLTREDLWEDYKATMSEYVGKGMIEEIPDEEVGANSCYYMPQQLVIKRDELGKVKLRPVFDASAKNPWGISANDIMEAGPPLQPDIVVMILKWRRWRVALSGDVEKAFLQISLNPKDRDMFRFLLLWEGGVKHYRFARVPFGGTSSPFMLNAVIRHHLSLFPGNPVAEELQDSIYVDNVLTGADSEEEAEKKFQEASNIFSKAGLQLKKWDSNSSNVINLLRENQVYQPETKVLGIKWDAISDYFSFSKIDYYTCTLTKRALLSVFSRIYDPLGLVGPFVLLAKILFQKAWQRTVGWDEQLPQDLGDAFQAWIQGTQELAQLQIPRAYFPGIPWKEVKESVEVHAFGDASQVGYGAVCYVRLRTAQGYRVSFAAARCRVAPLKVISLPRLELLAALCCARLARYVEKGLGVEAQVSCYTDSTVTLAWINGEPIQYKVFVGNRVSEIQKLVPKENWQHCPGNLNPADMASRGLSGSEMVSASTWFHGPDWLGIHERCPASAEWRGNVSIVDLELKATGVLISSQVVSIPGTVLERCGTIQQAIRSIGWMRRYFQYLKGKSKGQGSPKGPLTVSELAKGRTVLWKWSQQLQYPSEYQVLAEGKALPRGSPLLMLNPFLDEEGLMRVTGRLHNAELPYDQKHPIIIPKGVVGKLLIRETHQRLKHAGVTSVLTELRHRYHIITGRRMAKSVVHTCVPCQRQDRRPCNQVAPPLPRDRVMRAAPFCRTGVDFAGPLYVKGSRKKLYILLFCCAITRAVHLELTASLSTDRFVLYFRMFAARRGIPARVYSDNAKTFRGAQKELQSIYGPQCPRWTYSAPLAPWHGGWWERMVRSTKGALRKSVGNSTLTKEELAAVLTEVEQVLNSRPLTRLSEDPAVDGPLTPGHFLHAHEGGVQHDEAGGDINSSSLRLLHTARLASLEKFWKRFQNEYLTSLPAVVREHRASPNLRVGDLVFVRGEKFTPRLQWPLARVEEVHPGRDGNVRKVTVRTATSKLCRAVQKLHRLEFDEEDVSMGENPLLPVEEIEEGEIIPTDEQEKVSSQEKERVYTRSGREVKRPTKLNLLQAGLSQANC